MFVQCKNETEKLAALEAYCVKQVEQCTYSINDLEADRVGPLDYYEEIRDLKNDRARFETMLRIIRAEPYDSILIY